MRLRDAVHLIRRLRRQLPLIGDAMPAAAGFTSQALRAGAPRQGEAFGVRILKGTLEKRHLCESLCVCWRRGGIDICV